MVIKVFPTKLALAKAAASDAATRISAAIAGVPTARTLRGGVADARGRARVVAATGASQIEFLDQLTRAPASTTGAAVDWRRVEMFHLDEYIGLPLDHPASFRKYLLERLIRPAGIVNYHLLDGECDPQSACGPSEAPEGSASQTRRRARASGGGAPRASKEACREIGRALREAPIDVAFVGIGENGHLAFNDPPADFETDAPYIIVRLDEACRRQQVGEGWFADIAEVPETAISMTVRQILKANAIICVVPDRRKAEAVRACLEGPITPNMPASILRTHRDVTLYLDKDSAGLLSEKTSAIENA